MTIETKAYGPIEVNEENIYGFPFGIPGFDALTEWALFEADRKPFLVLQSLTRSEVAFFLMPPALCRADYTPAIEDNDYKLLKLEGKETEAVALVVVNIPNGDPERMSVNLQAPVIFNPRDRIAGQCISSDSRWKVRHLVNEELANAKRGADAC